jgi:hypothetical protein
VALLGDPIANNGTALRLEPRLRVVGQLGNSVGIGVRFRRQPSRGGDRFVMHARARPRAGLGSLSAKAGRLPGHHRASRRRAARHKRGQDGELAARSILKV